MYGLWPVAAGVGLGAKINVHKGIAYFRLSYLTFQSGVCFMGAKNVQGELVTLKTMGPGVSDTLFECPNRIRDIQRYLLSLKINPLWMFKFIHDN